MQLNPNPGSLRLKLAAASCALMGGVVAQPLMAADSSQVDSALLFYQENANRVQVIEPIVNIKTTVSDDSSLNLKLTLDTLTGGSPNGAIPSHAVQTFATPSGRTLTPSVATATTQTYSTYTTASGKVVTVPAGSSASSSGNQSLYTIAPGQLPLDSSFRNTRESVALGWEQGLFASSKWNVGAAFSNETDFRSFSLSTGIAQYFNNKNTTLAASVNLEQDSVMPIGGTPVPLSDYALFKREGNQSKHVADGLLGVTQVMSRRWITQLNLAVNDASGYQNDPYKVLSGLDAAGNVLAYVYENRPENRTRKSIYWGNKFALDQDVIDISYRYMTDDWGIRSSTVDGRYRMMLGDAFYIEPHARWYTQTAADFYHLYLTQGAPLYQYASADARLGSFDATTVGVKLGYVMSSTTEASFKVEEYQQSPKGLPGTVPSRLQGLNLNPGLKALVLQAGLRFTF